VVAALWGSRVKPAVLISLDGHNDLEHRLRVAAPGRFFLDPAYHFYLTRPFLVSHSQADNALTRASARRRLGAPAEYADAIPVYLEGQHSLTVMTRGLEASRLMVLPPFVAFKQPLSAEERAFTADAYRESAMRALYDQTAAAMVSLARSENAAFLDARPIFNGLDEAVFTDDAHFRTVRRYELLARAIASALPDDALGGDSAAGRP
jgi:hypothetical protein